MLHAVKGNDKNKIPLNTFPNITSTTIGITNRKPIATTAIKILFGVLTVLENNLMPSRIKLDIPKNVAIDGDCRCCVAASNDLSSADDTPDDIKNINTRILHCIDHNKLDIKLLEYNLR